MTHGLIMPFIFLSRVHKNHGTPRLRQEGIYLVSGGIKSNGVRAALKKITSGTPLRPVARSVLLVYVTLMT